MILDYRDPAALEPVEEEVVEVVEEEEPEDPSLLGHVKGAAKSVWRFVQRWVPGFSNWD